MHTSWLFTDITSSSYCSLKKELQHSVGYIEQISLPKCKKEAPAFLPTLFPITVFPPFHIRINVLFPVNWTQQYFVSSLFPQFSASSNNKLNQATHLLSRDCYMMAYLIVFLIGPAVEVLRYFSSLELPS